MLFENVFLLFNLRQQFASNRSGANNEEIQFLERREEKRIVDNVERFFEVAFRDHARNIGFRRALSQRHNADTAPSERAEELARNARHVLHVLPHHGNSGQIVFHYYLVDASHLNLFGELVAQYFLGERRILRADANGRAVFRRCLRNDKHADAVVGQRRENTFVYADNTHHAKPLYGDESGVVDGRYTFDDFSVWSGFNVADKRSFGIGFEGVFYADGNTFVVNGKNGGRINHFRPEVGELDGFGKRKFFNNIRRVDDFRIGCHKSVHIRPDFQNGCVECRGNNGRRVIRSATAEVGDIVAFLARRDKSRHDGNLGERVI